MEHQHYLDGYCERLAPGLFGEPLNLVTNLAFLIAAGVMWRRAASGMERAMCAVLAVIGAGSALFHGLATPWAAAADVVPILGFILLYVFAANRDYWRLPLWVSLAGTVLVLPYAAVAGRGFAELPFLAISAAYWPVALLIALYAAGFARHRPVLARDLGFGAGLLALSLVFRSLDMVLCPVWPHGTHFLWHLLNAVMLAWMIETHRRHTVATARPAG